MTVITLNERIVTTAAMGQFAFEILRQLGFSKQNHLIDQDGGIMPADCRIWQPTIIHLAEGVATLDQERCHLLHGRGANYVEQGTQTIRDCGMNELELQPLAEAMFREADRPLQQFWTPRHILYLRQTITAYRNLTIRELRGSEDEAFGFFLDNQHWVLMHVSWQGDCLKVTYYDGFYAEPSDDMEIFAEQIASATSAKHLEICYTKRINQSGGQYCGTIALLHLGILLGLEVEATEARAESWYRVLKSEMYDLQEEPSPTMQWSLTGFGPEDSQVALAKLLADKGVPAEKLDQRVRDVQACLGQTIVNQSLRARNPWAALKSAANAPGIRLRLLTQDEQEQYIQSRAKTKHGANISGKKKIQNRGQAPNNALTLDPVLLKINPDHFQDEKGKPIQQIQYSEVEAGGRGLAICSIQMAQPFLEDPKHISQDALGLLLTEAPPDEVSAKIGIVKMKFPATYVATQESILVMGGLLQLGDLSITRKHEGPNPAPVITKTAVLKLQIFREQFPTTWEDFVQAPLKHIIRALPALTLCDGINCGSECPRSHQALEEEVEQVIMEVWSRNFFREQGGKSTPDKADIYQVYIRVPSSSLHGILDYNVPGCYIEPRQDGLQGTHPDYGVIWLPRATFQSAQHACRTCPQALSIVRFCDRYGVRIAIKDEEKAWSLLRPQEKYQNLRITEVHEISPIPHGTTRAQVQEVLNAWGWKSKPLQMGRGKKEYSVWRVGADGPPPARVLRGFNSDILINPIKQQEAQVMAELPIAPWKTQTHLKQSASSSTAIADPWEQGHDPWARYQGPTFTKPNKDRTYLDTLSGNLKKEMAQHVQKELEAFKQADQHMEDNETHEKLAEMEGTMKELQAQNQRMQSWFTEASNKIQGLEQQAQVQQQAMAQQYQAINEVRQEVKNVVGETAGTLQSALQSIKSELLTQIQADLGKIEAKMEKRPRHE